MMLVVVCSRLNTRTCDLLFLVYLPRRIYYYFLFWLLSILFLLRDVAPAQIW